MATRSFPAEGEGGFESSQWSLAYSSPDGIVNDLTGESFGLQIVNSGGTARLTKDGSQLRVNGYTMVMDSETDLTIPPGAGTYYIAGCYDPNLNVADAQGNASPEGPVRLIIAPVLSTAAGEAYTNMYRLTRATAGAAPTITDNRQWVGDVFSVNKMPTSKLANPETNLGGWEHPMGSICVETTTHEIYIKRLGGEVGTYWQKTSSFGPFPVPVPSALIAQAADEPAEFYLTNNRSMVHLEGTLKRSNGANLYNGSDVILGTMPEFARPKKDGRWPCVVKLSSGWGTGHVRVSRDGTILLYDAVGTPTITFVDLSAISYRTR